jgi:hypothetical protein
MDCTTPINAQFCSGLGITGYPTLKFYTDGKAIDYTGGRTLKEILDWVNKKTSISIYI